MSNSKPGQGFIHPNRHSVTETLFSGRLLQHYGHLNPQAPLALGKFLNLRAINHSKAPRSDAPNNPKYDIYHSFVTKPHLSHRTHAFQPSMGHIAHIFRRYSNYDSPRLCRIPLCPMSVVPSHCEPRPHITRPTSW